MFRFFSKTENMLFLEQIASRELNIPMSCIHFCETSTTTVPNACASVGSAGTDVNGMAVKVKNSI